MNSSGSVKLQNLTFRSKDGVGEKIDFSQMYFNNLANVIKVVEVILKLWDLGYGKNMMRQKPN